MKSLRERKTDRPFVYFLSKPKPFCGNQSTDVGVVSETQIFRLRLFLYANINLEQRQLIKFWFSCMSKMASTNKNILNQLNQYAMRAQLLNFIRRKLFAVKISNSAFSTEFPCNDSFPFSFFLIKNIFGYFFFFFWKTPHIFFPSDFRCVWKKVLSLG